MSIAEDAVLAVVVLLLYPHVLCTLQRWLRDIFVLVMADTVFLTLAWRLSNPLGHSVQQNYTASF